MNHTIAGFDVGLRHLRMIDRNSMLVVNDDRLAVHGLHRSVVLECQDILSQDLAGYDVVGQD